ncbi:hypothetical protein QBC40DRAFT_312453 [Triangularia verruculosa]|uniref:Uncharacterized protein n=1 Tax=Triangularia verruculosa TaxID=2587418 RepID=A0AAN6XAG7_9PEZI|nr:hypothetical protein QBC40DRAFT_312453 [Triangularia verruculosa]
MHCIRACNGDVVRSIAGENGRLVTEKDSDVPIWHCDCGYMNPALLSRRDGKWFYICSSWEIDCKMFLDVDDARRHETSSLPRAQQQVPENWRRENYFSYKADMTRIKTQPTESTTVDQRLETTSVKILEDDHWDWGGGWRPVTASSVAILTPTATVSSARCPEEEEQSNQAGLEDELDLDKAIQIYQEARAKGKKAKEEVAVLWDKLRKAQAEVEQAEKEEMMALKPVARLSQKRVASAEDNIDEASAEDNIDEAYAEDDIDDYDDGW